MVLLITRIKPHWRVIIMPLLIFFFWLGWETSALESFRGCQENTCDKDYDTVYSYSDRNDKFLVQNVVKKPGCETFDIDFGDQKSSAGPKKRPELGRKSVAGAENASKSPRVASPNSPSKNRKRRPLRKVEKDVTNNAIRRIMTEDKNCKNTRPNSVGRFENRKLSKKPTTQGIFVCHFMVFNNNNQKSFQNIKIHI